MWKLRYNLFQKILEIITVVILVASIVYVAIRYSQIPVKIPTHFDLVGNPDGWGKKSSIFLIVGANVFLYIFMSICTFFPKMWNLPVKITEENQNRIYSYALDMLLVMKFIIVVSFTYMTVCSMEGMPLGIWFTIIMLGAVFGSLIFYIIKMVRNR